MVRKVPAAYSAKRCLGLVGETGAVAKRLKLALFYQYVLALLICNIKSLGKEKPVRVTPDLIDISV